MLVHVLFAHLFKRTKGRIGQKLNRIVVYGESVEKGWKEGRNGNRAAGTKRDNALSKSFCVALTLRTTVMCHILYKYPQK